MGSILYHANLFPMLWVWTGIGIRLDGMCVCVCVPEGLGSSSRLSNTHYDLGLSSSFCLGKMKSQAIPFKILNVIISSVLAVVPQAFYFYFRKKSLFGNKLMLYKYKILTT